MAIHEISVKGGLSSFKEAARGKDMFGVSGLVPIKERGLYTAKWTIEKYKGDYRTYAEILKKGAVPFEVLEIEGNLLLNEGINEVWTLVCGTGAAKFDTGAKIAVGNGTTAANATQTDLLGASTATATMDASYPTYGSSQKATWRSTFGTDVGNFAWEEISVVNTGAKNLNRKVQSMGTKASGTTWVATLEITLS